MSLIALGAELKNSSRSSGSVQVLNDVFTNHRKILSFSGKNYPTYLSSPYTRLSIKR
jgi:hypothetical protein